MQHGGRMHADGATLRLRVAARSALGAAAVVVLILAVTHLALRLPGLRLLAGFAPAAVVSYDRFLGELSPLTDGYIARVLGIAPAPARPAAPAATVAAGATTTPFSTGSATSPAGSPHAEPVELRHEFTNDDFRNAIRPQGLPFLARTDTSLASREEGEPSSCAPVGGTAWYAYRPHEDTTLTADTLGTSYAVALAVFRGTSLSSLEQLGCSRGVTGTAVVSVRAAAGQTYWFQVTGPAGGGLLTFSLTPPGLTSRASVMNGGQRDWRYHLPIAAVSDGGRYVVFSGAGRGYGSRSCGRLADGVEAWCYLLLLRDRVTGTTEVLLHASPRRPNTQDDETRQTRPGDRWSYYHIGPDLSADARYVSFHSDDPTLVPGDRNGHDDVFVLDRLTSKVERVSVSSTGGEGTTDRIGTDRIEYVAGSYAASMSADGRYVVFSSVAEGLVPGDTNHHQDVFVRDRRTGVTERVSVRTGGGQLEGPSLTAIQSAISDDGRYVVFTSYAPSISPQTRSGWCSGYDCQQNVFVHDRVTRTTTLVSQTADGRGGNGRSSHPTISADGRVVAFTSSASDLVPGDTNDVADVFWRELATGRTLRASVSSAGDQQRISVGQKERGNGAPTRRPAISLSADGRYLSFASAADNLVPGDGNGAFDAFVHDTRTRATTRVSVTESGGDGNDDSFDGFLSRDATTVVFGSEASNLVGDDQDTVHDIFVHDLRLPRRR